MRPSFVTLLFACLIPAQPFAQDRLPRAFVDVSEHFFVGEETVDPSAGQLRAIAGFAFDNFALFISTGDPDGYGVKRSTSDLSATLGLGLGFDLAAPGSIFVRIETLMGNSNPREGGHPLENRGFRVGAIINF